MRRSLFLGDFMTIFSGRLGGRLQRVPVLLLACCCGLGQPEVRSGDEPAAGRVATQQSLAGLSPAELQVRYAESRQRLAELNLERAKRANQLVPKVVGPREVDRLARHVELTRRQVEIARKNPRTTVKQTNLAAAEIAVADAQADLEAARKANERTADDLKLAAVAEVNIDRLAAVLEMAEIHLELLNRPNYVPSLIDEMQWHIDQLTNEVIDLRHQLETGGNNAFGAERP